MTNTRTEAQEQAAVVDFCALWGIEIVHVPNEGKRTLANGRQLARMGLRKGFPDLFIPIARKGYHGMFIELKRDIHCKATEHQQRWIKYLNEQGYYAVICYGADDAIQQIGKYFERKYITRR